MAISELDKAKSLLKRREFSKVVSVLDNPRSHELYHDIFDYYLYLGHAYLYIGDMGNASFYYQKARHIKLTDSNLLLGQAAIFLRRGETDRALKYYIDIYDKDPENQVVKKAMDFIKNGADFQTICKWADTGEIEQFYPPLGVNPTFVAKLVFSGLIGILLAFGILSFVEKSVDNSFFVDGPRADLSSLALNSSGNNGENEGFSVEESYGLAMQYFQDYRDNACQVEINKILNSGADAKIKEKAKQLANLLDDKNISFDNLPDNFDAATVQKNPDLYRNCFVSWSGRYANGSFDSSGNFSCDLLVGYEDQKKVEEIVCLQFEGNPNLIEDKAIVVLGKLENRENKLFIRVKSYHQPLRDKQN